MNFFGFFVASIIFLLTSVVVCGVFLFTHSFLHTTVHLYIHSFIRNLMLFDSVCCLYNNLGVISIVTEMSTNKKAL